MYPRFDGIIGRRHSHQPSRRCQPCWSITSKRHQILKAVQIILRENNWTENHRKNRPHDYDEIFVSLLSLKHTHTHTLTAHSRTISKSFSSSARLFGTERFWCTRLYFVHQYISNRMRKRTYFKPRATKSDTYHWFTESRHKIKEILTSIKKINSRLHTHCERKLRWHGENETSSWMELFTQRQAHWHTGTHGYEERDDTLERIRIFTHTTTGPIVCLSGREER